MPFFNFVYFEAEVNALVIFKYLLSIHQIGKLQSTLRIVCNSNTETFSTMHPTNKTAYLVENSLMQKLQEQLAYWR
jgi:hypothetical protein